MKPPINSHTEYPYNNSTIVRTSFISNTTIPQGARLVRTYLDHSRASNVPNYK